MAIGRINERSVEASTRPAGRDRVILWADRLQGFSLVAHSSGAKSYVVQSRKAGRSRRVKILTETLLSVEEARSKAKIVLGQIEAGLDPAQERRESRAGGSFKQVADEFMEVRVKAKKKPRTYDGYDVMLRKHVLPEIGSLRIKDVRRVDIRRLHTKLSTKKGIPGAANRCLTMISSIWNWAAKQDEVRFEDNPAKGCERNPENGCERFLTLDEPGRVGDAPHCAQVGLPYEVDENKPKSKHAPKPENRLHTFDEWTAAAVQLRILTGVRLREILHARWEYFDNERGIIFLPDRKTGRKPLYLSAAALDVLSKVKRHEDNPYIIPGQKEGEPKSDLKRIWRAATKAAGLEDLRIHDLRHTYASTGAAAQLGLVTIGRLLGQNQASTTARCAHLANDPVRRAAETIGAAPDGAMKRKTSEVVPQHRKDA
jgi:integrase